jgi:hypothetical protein
LRVDVPLFCRQKTLEASGNGIGKIRRFDRAPSGCFHLHQPFARVVLYENPFSQFGQLFGRVSEA